MNLDTSIIIKGLFASILTLLIIFGIIKTGNRLFYVESINPPSSEELLDKKKRERDKLGSVNLRADEETNKYQTEIKKMEKDNIRGVEIEKPILRTWALYSDKSSSRVKKEKDSKEMAKKKEKEK